MKTKSTFIKALLILVISGISIAASAQAPAPPPAPTPFTGPTVPAAAPNGTPVDHFICVGGNVSLISPTTSGVSNYLWWKENSAGTWVLVGNTPAPTNTYSETSTASSGYYTYKVQTENANGCESPISNPINIFALPPIVPVITAPTSVCQSITNIPAPFSLSVTPTNDANYTYTYQWTRNGVNIAGQTSPPLSGMTETAPGTVTYGVIISYATAGGQSVGTTTCTVTPSTTITVTTAPSTPVIQWN